MVNKQPEALRLAEWFEQLAYPTSFQTAAAAELRRLHAENELLKATQYGSGRLQELRDVRDKLLAENEDFRATCDHLTRENAGQIGEIVALKEQREELLEALRWYVETDEVAEIAGNEFWLEGRDRAQVAIAKATGEEYGI